jgi:pilus assembly protein CpaC
MHRIFPEERITVAPSRNAIVLSGHVSTEDVYKRAGDIATAYTKKVVNVLTFGPVGAQEVLLEVKFAEVDRTALLQWGANLFMPGQGHTVALSQTGQFGSLSTTSSPPTTTTQPDGTTVTTPANRVVNITDFLNLFVARTDVNVGAVIRALQQKNLLQILAEPNLIAVNGKEASFLAGGEFPFPVVQPGGVGGVNAVTVQFKEFGVRLKFLPIITPNGQIHLHVAPEVSTLDFANALTVSGVTIPALSTRRAETEFELQDGQSFIIAGLMDNRVTNLNNKVPWLGDIPILGQFFRSKSLSKSKSELVVLVTARRISPSQEGKLPEYPQPFLDQKQFDNKPATPKPPGQ